MANGRSIHGATRGRRAWVTRTRDLVVAVLVALAIAAGAHAAPVEMRFPEGPAHGFVDVSDPAAGKVLANGELIQWLDKKVVVSRLVFRFADGSLYDETVRFAQRPTFRLLSYELTQKGPSFSENSKIEFDRSGRYRASVTPHGEEEKHAEGTTEIPEDVSNGLTSVLAKNLPKGASARTHLMTFLPEPLALDLDITPEGTDTYWVGGASSEATRFFVKPTVPGVKGVLASIVGKQPPEVRMWIAPEPAPVLVRFEGALYVNGPVWRIELAAPRWKK